MTFEAGNNQLLNLLCHAHFSSSLLKRRTKYICHVCSFERFKEVNLRF